MSGILIDNRYSGVQYNDFQLAMKKVLITILVLLSIGIIAYFSFNPIKKLIKDYLPQTNDSHVNLPGKLIGNFEQSRPEHLDPEKIIYWTNKYRAENGLPVLTRNSLLDEAAGKKVQDMFAKQYFDHVSPDGVAPAELILSAGYNYRYTGENLAMGDFTDEKALVDAWMASPGHRANILNKNYSEIGVATGLNNILNYYTWLAVQEFGSLALNCSAPSKQLKMGVEDQNARLDSLKEQHTVLSAQYENLLNEANILIEQGNEIYRTTKNLSLAQGYWDQGKAKQTEAEQVLEETRNLETQMLALQAEINLDVAEYNSQVNSYNKCIGD